MITCQRSLLESAGVLPECTSLMALRPAMTAELFSPPSHTSLLYGSHQCHKHTADTCSGVPPSLRWLFLNQLEFFPHSQALNSKGRRISPAIVHCCDRQLCVLTDTCMPVYPPSVVASVSYCALPASASHTVIMVFPSEHQGG